MRANGSHARRLRKLPAGVSSPAWSPDGRSIAFAMGRTGRRGLYTLRTTGGGLRQVASRAARPARDRLAGARRRPGDRRGRRHRLRPELARFRTGAGHG